MMSDDILSDEDKELFRNTMKTVKPLSQTKQLAKQVKPLHKISRTQKVAEHTPSTNFYLSNHFTDIVGTDSVLSYCAQSIPRRRLNQLKNGQIPWQARLDLHGLNPDAARESLCHFIDQQMHANHRCLLIIHGKGSHHGEAPILKNHVNHWLQQLPNVLAFHSALPREGGSGAVYVLLRRQRSLDTYIDGP